MKKLNRLFATLIAMLGVGSLSAQTWTAPVIGQDLKNVNSKTELYMYNVKADAFASSYIPRRRFLCTSPARQALSAIIPS